MDGNGKALDIDPETRAALLEARAEGEILFFPRPYPFGLWERVDKTLKNVGGAWNRHKRGHIFKDRPAAEALAEAVGIRPEPPPSPLAFVPTSPGLALRIVSEFLPPGSGEAPPKALRILEPSAGAGAFLDAIISWGGTGHHIQCVELDNVRAEILIARGFRCVRADFLKLNPRTFPPFDRIFMHPPEGAPGNLTAYVDHIMRARNFLRRGGILAAVCPIGFLQANRHKKLIGFRHLVETQGRIESTLIARGEPGGLADRMTILSFRRASGARPG